MTAVQTNNENKICFITAVNDEKKYARCVKYLQALVVPDGMQVNYLAVRGAGSMTEAYQQARMASDAKYKIYLHQDVECINRLMLKRLITAFKNNSEYGILGVAGAEKLPSSAVWWDCAPAQRLGAVMDNHTGVMQTYSYRNDSDIMEAAALDGLLLATQYDVDWRSDLFKGWDFYDISQGMEFRRQGYMVGVIRQKKPWCRHNCGQNMLLSYDIWREVFRQEYWWGKSQKNKLTSIVIISYNTYQLTRLCIESIYRYTEPETYEIIVVDNASTDESVPFLKAQTGIKCVFNDENLGFPKGCNQGIEIATGTEILLLNSDTIVTPRWLSQLRYALYSGDNIGAVGCMSNCCSNRQQIDASYGTLEELEGFADIYNRTDSAKWVSFFYLVGYCLLIRRNVAEQVGILDERFTPGNCEDDDYSFRIREQGYKLLLCKDTFIHHFGSASFLKSMTEEEKEEKRKRVNELANRNRALLCEKWGISPYYCWVDKVITQKLPELVEAGDRILHIGCGCGLGMFFMQEKYPDAQITGIAYSVREAELAAWEFAVKYCADIEQGVFSLLEGKYRIIIVSDLQDRIKDAEGFLTRLMKYVNTNGAIYFMIDGENFIVERTGGVSNE